MSAGVLLKGRRFGVRFLGRPRAWLSLAATGGPAALAWYLAAVPARGPGGDLRGWFLWSGNLLVVLFGVSFVFSLRKWSIKLPWFRDWGRAAPERVDACWGEIQALHGRARRGAFPDERALLEEAAAVLRRHRVDGALRAVPDERVGPGGLRPVRLVKREPFGRLEPWLEIHIGAGTAACLGVLLHADFTLRHPVGWALLGLSAAVFLTGVAGALLFRLLPPALAAADPGIPFEEAEVARSMFQRCLGNVLATLPADLADPLRPLLRDAASPEDLRRRAGEVLPALSASHPDRAALLRDLAVMAGTRDFLRWSTRRSRRLDAAMRAWRWVHVPCSIALVFLVVLHVVLVLWY